MKKYKQWYKDHKSFLVRTIIFLFLLIALPLTVYLNSQSQDIRQKAATGGMCSRCSNNFGCTRAQFPGTDSSCVTPLHPDAVIYTADPSCPQTATPGGNNLNCTYPTKFCTNATWKGIPDWLGGGGGLGNGSFACTNGTEDNCREGVWTPGSVMPAGSPVGHGGTNPYFSNFYGGRIPVAYDGAKDKIRYDFSTHKNAESSWSRVLRWSDDILKVNSDLSPDVVIRHMIIRLKRDNVTNGRDLNQMGFDVSSLQVSDYVDGQAGIEKMRLESQYCVGAAQPSGAPVTDVSPTTTVSVTPSTATPTTTPSGDGTDQPITQNGDSVKDLTPKVVKDKNGNVHAVWNVTEPEDSTGILYATLTWDGTKYTQASQGIFGNANGCASQGCSPAMGVNDSLILYAWAGKDTVRVAGKNMAGVSQFVVDLTQMGFGLTPNITTGPDGKFYIVADGDSKTKLCVFNIEARNCSLYKEITQASSKPEVAVDSSGNIHILAGRNGVHYLTLKNGQSEFTDTTISSGNGQQITADDSGNVYLTWSEDYNIHFCKKTINTGCSGNATKVFSDGQATNPSIGITTGGNILIAYSTSGQTLRYVKYANNAWTTPASFGKTGSVSVDVSPRSSDNKLSAVWSSDWDIWHRYFTFTGTNTDTPTPTLSQAPDENTKINLTIGLDGIGSAGDYSNSASDKSNKDPKHAARSLALLFYDEQNNLKYTKLGSVTYDGESGNFKGSVNISDGIAEGRYYVKTKIDQYLLKTPPIIQIRIGDENTISRYTMVTGDINGDNHLSLLDYNILSNCYSDIKSKSDTCSADDAVFSDLNDDGLVNQFDYNLFVRELPKQEGD